MTYMQHTTFLQTILPTFFSICQELSKTYGLGYALLQRMGFRAGDALKPGALAAPLAARANLRRKGLRQGANEERRRGGWKLEADFSVFPPSKKVVTKLRSYNYIPTFWLEGCCFIISSGVGFCLLP